MRTPRKATQTGTGGIAGYPDARRAPTWLAAISAIGTTGTAVARAASGDVSLSVGDPAASVVESFDDRYVCCRQSKVTDTFLGVNRGAVLADAVAEARR